jgi:PAS domain S-box-containing protein
MTTAEFAGAPRPGASLPDMYEALVGGIPVMIKVYDGSGSPLFLNREFTRVLGWTLEEARKVDLMAECYPDPSDRREAWMFMAGAVSGWRDFKVRARDGRVVKSSWANVHRPDGLLVAIGIDISERESQLERMDAEIAAYRAHHERLMEQKFEQLRGSEARFEKLLESLSDWVWEVDLNGVYTYVSPGVRALLGYEPGELIGKTPFDVMPPGEAARVREIFESCMRNADPLAAVENVNLHRDGRTVVLETSGMPFFDADGTLLGYRGVDRDVGDRKAAERALQESEERFRTLADQVPLAVYETDDEGRFAYMNRHGLELFGYAEEDLRGGLTLFDLIGPLDRDRARETFRTRIADGVAKKADEYTWLRKDGTQFPAVACAAPFRRGGGNAGIGGMLMDLSYVRQAERELFGAQKYEMVGRIAGGLAHHLNNLMTIVAGYGTLIVDRMDVRSPWRRQVEEMRIAGERAATLTSQLLAYSRRQVLRPEKIAPHSFLVEFEGEIRRTAGARAEVSLRPEPGGPVMADPEMLRNAVLRLVENSRDAMPDGGVITVTCRDVDVSGDEGPPVPAGKYVMIAVSDTGIGMDPATRAQLFEPFFTTKAPGSGAGLSLPSVYGFVKQSKGYIFADSEPGEGTTISIYLLRADPEPVA